MDSNLEIVKWSCTKFLHVSFERNTIFWTYQIFRVFSLFSDDIADGRITLILKKLEATVEEDGCLQQLL